MKYNIHEIKRRWNAYLSGMAMAQRVGSGWLVEDFDWQYGMPITEAYRRGFHRQLELQRRAS